MITMITTSMMIILEVIAWMLGAYLLAGIPVGLLIGRARGVDLREVGSGNIGATNAVRAMGRRWGLLVFALDVGKAALPVALASMRFADPRWIAWIALAAILGHVFPVYLRFRGGKGVACALGVFADVVVDEDLGGGVVDGGVGDCGGGLGGCGCAVSLCRACGWGGGVDLGATSGESCSAVCEQERERALRAINPSH
jgi:hypothetical protein